MSIRVEDIPSPFPVQFYSLVPQINLADLVNLRSQVDITNLTNSCNLLHEYIDELAKIVFIYQKYTTFDEFIQAADRFAIYDVPKGGPVWKNYPIDLSEVNQWSILDELIVSVYTLNMIYTLRTIQLIQSTIQQDKIAIDNWQKCNNYLKISYGYLMSFKLHVPSSHQKRFAISISICEFYTQLIVILKNIWDLQNEIDDNMGRLDHGPKNVGMYIKLVVFMHNQLKVIEQQNGPWGRFMNIILGYYLGLQSWQENSMGWCVSYIQCSLVLGLEQGEVRGKLKDTMQKIKIGSKFKIVKERDNVRSKELFQNEIKLDRCFRGQPLLQEAMTSLVKLLRLLYVKFDKINENLSFEKVIPVDEVKSNHLFNATNLPNGIKVPLNSYTKYEPIELTSKANNISDQQYF